MKSIFQLFVRKTNSNPLIYEIDFLRFISIITVMVFHLNSSLTRYFGLSRIEDSYELLGGGEDMSDIGWWLRRMDLGVRIFFAISGMVLAMPFIKRYLAKEPYEPVWSFYKRRFFRLEPLFIFSLIAFTLVHLIIQNKPSGDTIQSFFATAFYSHVLIFGHPSPINPVTWSLETEFQFYLICPFVIAFIFAYNNRYWISITFLLLIVATLFIRNLLFFENNHHLNQSVLLYISNFSIGILFAWVYVRFKWLFVRKSLLWDITTVISIMGLFYFYKPQDDWTRNLIFNSSILGLFFGVFKGRLFNKLSKAPILVLIGGMCYTLYLFHLGAFHFIVPFFMDKLGAVNYSFALAACFCVVIPLTILFCSVIYLLIEKPTMDARWPRKLIYFIFGKGGRKSTNAVQ